MLGKPDTAMLGGSGYERVENDFYPSPENVSVAFCIWATKVGLISTSSKLLEPAAGNGAMVNVLKRYVARVIATDIAPQMPGALRADFLKLKIPDVDGIVTNPPYGDLVDAFMARGIDWIKDGDSRFMALLMRNEVDNAVTRRWAFKDCPVFAAKLPLLWRPRWIADSTGSPRHNYSWFVWSSSPLNLGCAQIDYLPRPE